MNHFISNIPFLIVLVGICPGGIWHGGYCPAGICPGGICPGGICPGGICPDTIQIHVRKQMSMRCNRIEHWVHLRCSGIRQAQSTDFWACHLHR